MATRKWLHGSGTVRVPASLRIVAVSVCLLAGHFFLGAVSRSESVPEERRLAEFPMQIQGWQGEPWQELDAKILEVLGVDQYIDRIYHGPDGEVAGLYVGYYSSQREGQTIHSPMNCLPGSGWNVLETDRLEIPVRGSKAVEVKRLVIQQRLHRNLVLYWYQSHGRVLAGEYGARLATVLDAIAHNRTDAALVRVISPIAAEGEDAERDAEREAVAFVQSVFPLLSSYLPD